MTRSGRRSAGGPTPTGRNTRKTWSPSSRLRTNAPASAQAANTCTRRSSRGTSKLFPRRCNGLPPPRDASFTNSFSRRSDLREFFISEPAGGFEREEVLDRRVHVFGRVGCVHDGVFVGIVVEPERVPQLMREHPHELPAAAVLEDIYFLAEGVSDVLPLLKLAPRVLVDCVDAGVDVLRQRVVARAKRVDLAGERVDPQALVLQRAVVGLRRGARPRRLAGGRGPGGFGPCGGVVVFFPPPGGGGPAGAGPPPARLGGGGGPGRIAPWRCCIAL